MSATSIPNLSLCRNVQFWMVLVVGVVLGGREACASCGDHLAMPGTPKFGVHLVMPDSVDMPKHQPCTGPSCRSLPELPADPLPLDSRGADNERPVLLATSFPLLPARSLFPRAVSQLFFQEDHSASLDRPPRSV